MLNQVNPASRGKGTTGAEQGKRNVGVRRNEGRKVRVIRNSRAVSPELFGGYEGDGEESPKEDTRREKEIVVFPMDERFFGSFCYELSKVSREERDSVISVLEGGRCPRGFRHFVGAFRLCDNATRRRYEFQLRKVKDLLVRVEKQGVAHTALMVARVNLLNSILTTDSIHVHQMGKLMDLCLDLLDAVIHVDARMIPSALVLLDFFHSGGFSIFFVHGMQEMMGKIALYADRGNDWVMEGIKGTYKVYQDRVFGGKREIEGEVERQGNDPPPREFLGGVFAGSVLGKLVNFLVEFANLKFLDGKGMEYLRHVLAVWVPTACLVSSFIALVSTILAAVAEYKKTGSWASFVFPSESKLLRAQGERFLLDFHYIKLGKKLDSGLLEMEGECTDLLERMMKYPAEFVELRDRLLSVQTELSRMGGKTRLPPVGVILQGPPHVGKTIFVNEFLGNYMRERTGYSQNVSVVLDYDPEAKYHDLGLANKILHINDGFSVKDEKLEGGGLAALLRKLVDTNPIQVSRASIEDKKYSHVEPDIVVVSTNLHNYNCLQSTYVENLTRRYFVLRFAFTPEFLEEMGGEKACASWMESNPHAFMARKLIYSLHPLVCAGQSLNFSSTDFLDLEGKLWREGGVPKFEFRSRTEFERAFLTLLDARFLRAEEGRARVKNQRVCVKGATLPHDGPCECDANGHERQAGEVWSVPFFRELQYVRNLQWYYWGVVALLMFRFWMFNFVAYFCLTRASKGRLLPLVLVAWLLYLFSPWNLWVLLASEGLDWETSRAVRIAVFKADGLRLVSLSETASIGVLICKQKYVELSRKLVLRAATAVSSRLSQGDESVKLGVRLAALALVFMMAAQMYRSYMESERVHEGRISGDSPPSSLSSTLPSVSPTFFAGSPSVIPVTDHFSGRVWVLQGSNGYLGKGMRMNATRLSKDLFVTAKHFFEKPYSDYEVSRGNVRCSFKKKEFVLANDVAFFRVDGIPGEEEDCTSLLIPRDYSFPSSCVLKGIESSCGSNPNLPRGTVEYVGRRTQMGDCGLPVSSPKGLFLGIHTGMFKDRDFGFFDVVFREDYEAARVVLCPEVISQGFQVRSEPGFFPGSDLDWFFRDKDPAEFGITPVAHVKRGSTMAMTGKKTSMFPVFSQWLKAAGGESSPPRTTKAWLAPSGKWVSIVVNKLESLRIDRTASVDSVAMDRVFLEIFRDCPEPRKSSPLNVEQAVFGLPGVSMVRAMDMKKAVGLTLKGRGVTPVSIVQDGVLHPYFLEEIHSWWQVLREGSPRRVLVEAVIKDEMIASKKVDEGKGRFFYVMDKAVNVHLRRYLLPIMVWVAENFEFFGFYGLMNAASSQWDAMVKRLLKFSSSRLMDADHKGFDSHHRLLFPYYRRFCREGGKRLGYTPSELKEMDVLLLSAEGQHVVMMGDEFFQDHGLASGRADTLFCNVIMTLLITLYAMDKEGCPRPFREHVVWCSVGDDVVLASSPASGMDMVKMARHATSLGYVMTSATKDQEITPFTPLEKISFLKRGFRWENGLWRAPLSQASITKSLCYLTKLAKGVTEEERNRSALDSASREMFLHGEEEFDKFVDLALKVGFVPRYRFAELEEAYVGGTFSLSSDTELELDYGLEQDAAQVKLGECE